MVPTGLVVMLLGTFLVLFLGILVCPLALCRITLVDGLPNDANCLFWTVALPGMYW